MKYLDTKELLILKKLIIEDDNNNLDKKRYSLPNFIYFKLSHKPYNYVTLIGCYLCELKDKKYFDIEDLQISEDFFKNRKSEYHYLPPKEDRMFGGPEGHGLSLPKRPKWVKHLEKLKNQEYLSPSDITEILTIPELDKILVSQSQGIKIGSKTFVVSEVVTEQVYPLSFRIVKKNFKGLRKKFSDYVTAFKKHDLNSSGKHFRYDIQKYRISLALNREKSLQGRNIIFRESDVDGIFKNLPPDYKYRFYETLFAMESEGFIKIKDIIRHWNIKGHGVLLDTTNKFDDYLRSKHEETDKGIAFDKSGELKYKDKVIEIPKDTKQYSLCKVMFAKKVKIGDKVSWDIIAEEYKGSIIAGQKVIDTEKKEWRKVYDAVNAINKKVKEKLGVEKELFLYKDKSVIRLL